MTRTSRGVTVVATLLNEADALPVFLDSLLAQTRKPDEIILVDGGSTDSSCDIIRERIDQGAHIQLVIEEGANRSRGRNEGISRATQALVAVTDVGCRLEPDWLEKLVAPLERGEADVASGYYVPDAQTPLEKAIAAATVPTAKEVNPKTFLPSSRSVAFTVEAWEQAGGYPEWTSEGEDTLFDKNMQADGQRFVFVPDALVHWRQQSTIGALYRQFYAYAKSDGALGQTFGHYRKAFFLVGLMRGMVLVISLLTMMSMFLPLLDAMQVIPSSQAHQLWNVLHQSHALPVVLALFAFVIIMYTLRYLFRTRKRGWDWSIAFLSVLVMMIVDFANYRGYRVGERIRGYQ
jgi:glycosyltransferase involved in cell wall biosynthesis